MKNAWDIDRIKGIFNDINKLLGLEVSCEIIKAEKAKFPFCRKNGELIFVDKFFNHPLITDIERKMLAVEMYSCVLLDKKKDGRVAIAPEILAKGICEALGSDYSFISDYEMEKKYRVIRQELFDEPEYYSFFTIGDSARAGGLGHRKVVDIYKNEDDTVMIAVQPTKSYADKYIGKTLFTEEEMYEDVYGFLKKSDCVEHMPVDIRRNLYVISAPSGTGKNSVYNLLKEKINNIQRVITATTRDRRGNESNGIDYYFLTVEEFYNKQSAGDFVETNIYDGHHYATPVSEIEKYETSIPVFLIIDTHGKYRVQCRYPLLNSIFLMPPSIDELRNRLMLRGDNTPESIEIRINEAIRECERAKTYDHIIINDNIDDCVKQLIEIVNANQSLSKGEQQ